MTATALLLLSAAAHADVAPPPAASSASAPPAASSAPAPPAASSAPAPPAASGAPAHTDDVCDEAAIKWAAAASARTGKTITLAACPSGLVRLSVAGAGCDFEVRRREGFQHTADGAFGVSPIANLDWNTAPEPMKQGLAAVLAALAADPSIPIRSGHPMSSSEHAQAVATAARNNRIFVGAGALVLTAAAVGMWLRRRKTRGATPPAAS
jgi:hypothetical protein